MLADPLDDSIFYECNRGLAFKFHCPARLYFDATRSSCQFRHDGTTNVPDHHKSTFDCSGKPDGFYADPKNPSAFHECVDGFARDFLCPAHTVFDTRLRACAFDTSPHPPAAELSTPPSRHTTPPAGLCQGEPLAESRLE